MKTKILNSVVLLLFVLVFLTYMGSKIVQGWGPQDDFEKVDFEKYYQNNLIAKGVNDFSTENLIKLIDSENVGIRKYSILLLGKRNETSAIPAIEAALEDKSFYVKRAAADSLLQMGNRTGIPVLIQLCQQYAQEWDSGNRRNLTHLADAVNLLADAEELSAIPYLRKLLRDENWAIRLTSLQSLGKLHPKDMSVLGDITSMQNDENSQIREEAAKIIKRIEQNKKPAELNQ